MIESVWHLIEPTWNLILAICITGVFASFKVALGFGKPQGIRPFWYGVLGLAFFAFPTSFYVLAGISEEFNHAYLKWPRFLTLVTILISFILIVTLLFKITWNHPRWIAARAKNWHGYDEDIENARFERLARERAFPAMEREPPEPQRPTHEEQARDLANQLGEKLTCHPTIKREIVRYTYAWMRDHLDDFSSYDLRQSAFSLNQLASYLPPGELLVTDLSNGTTWHKHFIAYIDSLKSDLPPELGYTATAPRALWEYICNIAFSVNIPERLRDQHHHIVGGAGHGKTTLIKDMLAKDIAANHPLIVIDSQGDLIRDILVSKLVPEDRLILIDPTRYTPPAPLFTKPQTESDLAAAMETYGYIFTALDADMTSSQATVYRYVALLCMEIPGANIRTMLDIMRNGAGEYEEAVARLSDTSQAFLAEFDGKQYRARREEIVRRLFTLLDNPTFERMFAASQHTIHLKQAFAENKIILINTAKELLREQGSSLFGRYWIGQIAQAVFSRSPEQRKRTYLYIDEAHEYASEAYVNVLLAQSRKYGLGLVFAHQFLDQLPPEVQASLSANTAIKFAGGVSAKDARALAAQMQVDPSFILNQPQLGFAAWFRGIGTTSFMTKYDQLTDKGVRTVEEIDQLVEVMKATYGITSTPVVKKEEITPPGDRGDGW